MYYTTLNRIYDRLFYDRLNGTYYEDDWKVFLNDFGRTEADDEPVSLADIFHTFGLHWAVKALTVVDGIEDLGRLYAVRCVRQVQHLLKDQRSLDALDVAEWYAVGEASKDQLRAAHKVAQDAVGFVPWVIRASRCVIADKARDEAVQRTIWDIADITTRCAVMWALWEAANEAAITVAYEAAKDDEDDVVQVAVRAAAADAAQHVADDIVHEAEKHIARAAVQGTDAEMAALWLAVTVTNPPLTAGRALLRCTPPFYYNCGCEVRTVIDCTAEALAHVAAYAAAYESLSTTARDAAWDNALKAAKEAQEKDFIDIFCT